MARDQFSATIDTVTKQEWSAYLELFEDANLYHTWDYASVIYPGQQNHHVVLVRGPEVAALAQVRVKAIPGLGFGLANVWWGPLWRRTGDKPDLNTFETMLELLTKEFVHRRRLRLRIVPNVTDQDGTEILLAFNKNGFKPVRLLKPYRTFYIDLSMSETDIRKSLSPNWRKYLNRAERNELKVLEDESGEAYATFSEMYKEFVARKEFKSWIGIRHYGELQKRLPQMQKMRIFLALHNDIPAAGLMVSALGKTGLGLLGGTSTYGLKLWGSYLLFWRGIQYLKSSGCNWFDLGGLNPEKNPGVYHFKKGMGGRDVTFIGAFDKCESHTAAIFGWAVDRLRHLRRLR